MKEDRGEVLVDEKTQAIIDGLMAMGQTQMAEQLCAQFTSDPNKDSTYHYLPYRMDSGFESRFLSEVITLQCIHDRGLEVYYNGDGQFTEFRIDCFRQNAHKQWVYIGKYTPDFLIVQRMEGKIHRVLIVETKGGLYAQDKAFRNRKAFVETEFLRQNNDKFGYRRFDYLYLEDTLTEQERINQTNNIITQFFA